ncbi:MAG TPA: SH3 domain-containing protein [Chthoniobacterales bacterium]|jgi:SH3-like domain-containing protein
MLVEVIKAYKAQYKDPISFERDVIVQVLREDSEFLNWFWCRAPSGNEGWVHRSFLADTAATTKTTRPYSARELTVDGGESGTMIESLDGWTYIRLDSGVEGWLPQSHVRTVAGF